VIKPYGRGRFEIFVVAAAIGIIATVGLARYSLLARDARNLSFELTAHYFMTGAANLRTQWLMVRNADGGAESYLSAYAEEASKNLSGALIFSSQGWPLGLVAPSALDLPPIIENCYQLWMSLLQDPAPISIEGKTVLGNNDYHVSVQGNACRYRLYDEQGGDYYFDYFPEDGRMLRHVSGVME